MQPGNGQPTHRLYPMFTLDSMQEPDIFPTSAGSIDMPDPESVQRLLAALGEWGVAEVEGAPETSLALLAERAMDAYRDVATVA